MHRVLLLESGNIVRRFLKLTNNSVKINIFLILWVSTNYILVRYRVLAEIIGAKKQVFFVPILN